MRDSNKHTERLWSGSTEPRPLKKLTVSLRKKIWLSARLPTSTALAPRSAKLESNVVNTIRLLPAPNLLTIWTLKLTKPFASAQACLTKITLKPMPCLSSSQETLKELTEQQALISLKFRLKDWTWKCLKIQFLMRKSRKNLTNFQKSKERLFLTKEIRKNKLCLIELW